MPRRALLSLTLLFACGDSTATTTLGTTATTSGPGTTSTSTTGTTGSTSTGEDTTGDSGSGAPTTGGTSSTSGVDSSTTGTTTGTTTSDTTTTTGTTTTGTTTSDTTTTGTTGTTDDSTSSSTSSSTGDDTGVLPPNLMGQCTQGQLTTFVAPDPVEPELHIVGVYEPTAVTIDVEVTRTGVPLVLVLSSYEPVLFVLDLAPGVLLQEVVLNGYNIHNVQGHGDALVTDRSGVGNYLVACGYEWPFNDGGCDTPGLAAGAEALTGLSLTSFAGCYQASHFWID